MTYQERYETLIEKYIERKRLSISLIQRESKAGFKVACSIYQEWKNYHNELFWHNVIYEISFMDEVPTPVRIMKEFNVSYYFASKLFDYFIEVSDVK